MVLTDEMRVRHIPPEEHAQLRWDVRVLESVALSALYEK